MMTVMNRGMFFSQSIHRSDKQARTNMNEQLASVRCFGAKDIAGQFGTVLIEVTCSFAFVRTRCKSH